MRNKEVLNQTNASENSPLKKSISLNDINSYNVKPNPMENLREEKSRENNSHEFNKFQSIDKYIINYKRRKSLSSTSTSALECKTTRKEEILNQTKDFIITQLNSIEILI